MSLWPARLNWHGDIGAGRGIDPTTCLAQIEAAGKREIVLTLTTDGGYVADALRIAEALAAHKPGVVVGVPLRCHSAGLLLLAAGWERVGRAGSKYLAHETALPVSAVHDASPTRMALLAKKVTTAQARYVSFVASRIGRSVGEVRALMERDKVLTADEAWRARLLSAIWMGGMDAFRQFPGR